MCMYVSVCVPMYVFMYCKDGISASVNNNNKNLGIKKE